MITNMKIALAAVLVLGAASLAQAANENDGGNETGGYVLPPNMTGVNPAYHPGWFPQYGRANTAIYSGGAAFGFVPPTTHHKHPSAR
jgi:hypothetical protein